MIRTQKEEKILDKMVAETPAKRWQKRIRAALIVGVALAVVWFLVQFGFSGLDDSNDAMLGKYAQGATVFYDRFFDSHEGCSPGGDSERAFLKPLNVVFFKTVHDAKQTRSVSQVVGLPGQEIKYNRKTGRGVIVNTGGEDVVFQARAELDLPEKGVIPPLKFIVLNYNVKSEWPDSRDFGYLDVKDIIGKVISGFRF